MNAKSMTESVMIAKTVRNSTTTSATQCPDDGFGAFAFGSGIAIYVPVPEYKAMGFDGFDYAEITIENSD